MSINNNNKNNIFNIKKMKNEKNKSIKLKEEKYILSEKINSKVKKKIILNNYYKQVYYQLRKLSKNIIIIYLLTILFII